MKIKFNTGKEIELTKEELQELLMWQDPEKLTLSDLYNLYSNTGTASPVCPTFPSQC
jgi:hypothetical protein